MNLADHHETYYPTWWQWARDNKDRLLNEWYFYFRDRNFTFDDTTLTMHTTIICRNYWYSSQAHNLYVTFPTCPRDERFTFNTNNDIVFDCIDPRCSYREMPHIIFPADPDEDNDNNFDDEEETDES